MKLAIISAACILLAAVSSNVLAHGEHAPATKAADTTRMPYFKDIRGDYSAGAARWWKGNTHTHTWWSDGDSPPENAAAWYREHGYQFLVLSDHNRMQEGNLVSGALGIRYSQWYPIYDEARDKMLAGHIDSSARGKALALYRERFGDDWVQTRTNDKGVTEARLKTLDEFRHLFEAPGEFTFIKGEEITDQFGGHPFHSNGVNIHEVIVPRGGSTATEIIQNNLNAVLDQGLSSGREVLSHINHPNFRYAMTVEDMIPLRYRTGEGFFELYNGHHGVENYGDAHRMGLEKMWDVILAKRIAEGDGALMYGIANDDAHSFQQWDEGKFSNPGRGWVMVRAARLTPDSIVGAMKRGDFYGSTGVTLNRLEQADNVIDVSVEAEDGIEYTVEFIGTRRGADLKGREITDLPADMQGRASLRYGKDIGVVLKTVRGAEARYEAKGNELYVRARITSTRLHPNPFKAGDVEMAWTQPIKINAKR